MNDHVHETYDSEEEAISSAHEILALIPFTGRPPPKLQPKTTDS